MRSCALDPRYAIGQNIYALVLLVVRHIPLLYCEDSSRLEVHINQNMHRLIIPFLSILLALLPIPSSSLTISSLDLIDQSNHTADPLLRITAHQNLNITNLPPPICYFITDPPMSTLSNLKCSFLVDDICSSFTSPDRIPRDRWIWAEISGCAMGYYFPRESILPTHFTCEVIFGRIRRECATEVQYNAGGINVGQLPDFSHDGTELFPYQGRYLMAPERLTL